VDNREPVLWCESCDVADIRSGDWSGDQLGNKGGGGHVIWKRERWVEKKNVPWNITPLKPNEIPQGIWDTITMDFITDLPTLKEYDSILTIIDRHSKAIILSPCNKNITAVETSQLLLDNIWKRTGFPLAIILDWGPQFAAQVTQELWRKLGIKQKLSTAFYLQTDRESEQVNQEIEQYLCICGNFQQDNWATLLPLIKFAHNA